MAEVLSQSVHRNLSLFCLALIAMHVVTTVADGYVPIGLLDTVVPFRTPYRPLWVGFGALALDMLLAVAITSGFGGASGPGHGVSPLACLCVLADCSPARSGLGQRHPLVGGPVRQCRLRRVGHGCGRVAAGHRSDILARRRIGLAIVGAVTLHRHRGGRRSWPACLWVVAPGGNVTRIARPAQRSLCVGRHLLVGRQPGRAGHDGPAPAPTSTAPTRRVAFLAPFNDHGARAHTRPRRPIGTAKSKSF